MGCAVLAAGAWLYKNFMNSDTQMSIYIVLATGAGVLLVALLILVGGCKRAQAWGRCMLYILCVTLFLVVVVEALAAGFVYKYSGAQAVDAGCALASLCCPRLTFQRL